MPEITQFETISLKLSKNQNRKDFFQTADQHLQEAQTYVPQPVKKLDELLEDSFIVGGNKSDLSPKNFLIQNMKRLKEDGFDVLFVQDFFYDLQDELDNYLQGKTEVLDYNSLDHISNLDYCSKPLYFSEENSLWKHNNYAALIEAAKATGIRIVGLNTYYNFHLRTELENKVRSTNYIAHQIIQREMKDKQVKWVALTNLENTKKYCDIPGLSNLTGKRTLVVEDYRNTTKDDDKELLKLQSQLLDDYTYTVEVKKKTSKKTNTTIPVFHIKPYESHDRETQINYNSEFLKGIRCEVQIKKEPANNSPCFANDQSKAPSLFKVIDMKVSEDFRKFHQDFRSGELSRNDAEILVEHAKEYQLRLNDFQEAFRNTAWKQNKEVFHLLFQQKLPLDVPDSHGYTALMGAVVRDPEMVELLVKNQQNIDLQNDYGETALLYLLKHGFNKDKFSIVKTLLSAGSDPTIADNKGTTPLSFVLAKYDDDVILKTMLSHCKQTNKFSIDIIQRILELAVDKKDLQYAELLFPTSSTDVVRHNCDLDYLIRSSWIRKPEKCLTAIQIYHACIDKNIKNYKQFLGSLKNNGIDIDPRNDDHMSTLKFLASKFNLEYANKCFKENLAGTKFDSTRNQDLINLNEYIAEREKKPEYSRAIHFFGYFNRPFSFFGHKFNLPKTRKLAAAKALKQVFLSHDIDDAKVLPQYADEFRNGDLSVIFSKIQKHLNAQHGTGHAFSNVRKLS